MDLDFSDDQKALRDEFARFLTRHANTDHVRELQRDAGPGYDQALWDLIAAQGWLGVTIPEVYGGLGLSQLELCLIAEELGRALAAVPFSSTVYLFASAIMEFGSEEQKARWLPLVARGEIVGCLAVSEGPGDLGCERPLMTTFDGTAMSGEKLPVADGIAANAAIVLANGPEGVALYVVDLEGCDRRSLPGLDQSKGYAALRFDQATAEALPGADNGWDAFRKLLDRSVVPLAFEQLGGAERALEMAVAYAKERRAFGRPIGGFQAIKHKLAEIFIQNQLARSHAYFAAWALESRAPDLTRAAAGARLSAIAASELASRENIQVHGGIGFTWEADCHLYYRRAAHLALIGGSSRYWRDRLVAEIAGTSP
ncbi:MAG: acyl-CoA/acyl-ACP dehydrogenase [Sphingomonadales bacterium]|nr:acyl-CoA/acyl-ACP dehydrogenase [Sphingomonadaceae bacterium]MBS3932547.1 acyl-CoA/acyl-ACP dehydrogenase [Sphingomonadales bacterium]